MPICALEKRREERGGGVREADNLVGRLAIVFEVELGLGPAVLPVFEALQLAPSQRPLRKPGALDGDAHARRLPGVAGFARGRLRRGDDAPGDEALSTLVFAREDVDRIAYRDVLAAVHGLLRGEDESLCTPIADLSFDRIVHARPSRS